MSKLTTSSQRGRPPLILAASRPAEIDVKPVEIQRTVEGIDPCPGCGKSVTIKVLRKLSETERSCRCEYCDSVLAVTFKDGKPFRGRLITR